MYYDQRLTVLFLHLQGPPRSDILVSSLKVAPPIHFADLGRATFCLCPAGFSNWSYRMVEAILSGCIPVLFPREREIQPFEHLLGGVAGYDKFAVVVTMMDEGPDVEEMEVLRMLRELPASVIRAKRAALKVVAPLFSYHRCGAVMFVEAVARRALQARREAQAAQEAQEAQQNMQLSPLPSLPSPPTPYDVDVVITWVNGSHSSHVDTLQHTKQAYFSKRPYLHGKSNVLAGDSSSQHRFRDRHELRFALRSIAMNAPWVRRIYVVVANAAQIPNWLVTKLKQTKQTKRRQIKQPEQTKQASAPEIRVVYHADYFPPEEIKAGALPTFNSNAIETYLHRIPELSEHFVIMNDDCFFGKPIGKQDLYLKKGTPLVSFQFEWGQIAKKSPTGNHATMGRCLEQREIASDYRAADFLLLSFLL